MVNSISPTPAPPSSLVLSTAALPARDRLPVWREVFGHSMVRLDIEPVKSTFFHAEGELRVLPGAAFAAVSVTPVRVSRTQKLIAEDMADMAFVITADVPFHVTQNGRERMLDAGDAIFLRGVSAAPSCPATGRSSQTYRSRWATSHFCSRVAKNLR